MSLNRIINLQHIIDIKDEAGENIFALTGNVNTNKIIRDLFMSSIKKEKRQTISPRDREYLYKLLQPQTPFFDKLDRSPDVQQAYLIIKNILCINKTDHQIYIYNHIKDKILGVLEEENEKIVLQDKQFINNGILIPGSADYDMLQKYNPFVEELKVGMINPESPRKYEEIRDENELNDILARMKAKRLIKTSKIISNTTAVAEVPSEEDILEAISLHDGNTYTNSKKDKDLGLSDDELDNLLSRMKAKNAISKKEKAQA